MTATTGDREPGPGLLTALRDREAAYEAKFARDEEVRFLALARRDKLFALWAVAQLHLSGAPRAAFIHDLLAVQGFPDHDAALLRFVAVAFAAAGLAAGEAPATLNRLGREAHEQVLQGDAPPIDLSAAG